MPKAIITRRSFQWVLVVSFVVLLLFSFVCWSAFNFLSRETLSPRESALRQTQQVLAFIETHPNDPMPNSFPGYLRGSGTCWAFLQQGMTSNTNQYKLTVTDEYDSQNDPRAVHEMTEVWLHIDFPDGQRAEMYYSQGGLTGCREMK